MFALSLAGQNPNPLPTLTRRKGLTGKVCSLRSTLPVNIPTEAAVARTHTVLGLRPPRRCARVAVDERASAAAAGAGEGRARLLAPSRDGRRRAGERAEEHHPCDEMRRAGERWAWPPRTMKKKTASNRDRRSSPDQPS